VYKSLFLGKSVYMDCNIVIFINFEIVQKVFEIIKPLTNGKSIIYNACCNN
jgi:hypothetical protein